MSRACAETVIATFSVLLEFEYAMKIKINSILNQKSGKRVLLIFKVHIMVYENIFQAVKVFYIVHSSINLSIKRFQAK